MCRPCVASPLLPSVPPADATGLSPTRRAPQWRLQSARRAGTHLLALAGGLASLLGCLSASPVAAYSFPTTVRLSIEEVKALTPSAFGDCHETGADFYALVQVNGGVKARFRPIPNADHIFPTWKMAAPVAAGATTVPIVVEILDDDSTCDWPSTPPDHADISPESGTHRLELTVTLGNVPCTVQSGSGAVSGLCGQSLTAAGQGDPDGNVEIRLRVEAFPNLPDSDADGLPDDWEQNGVTLNGQFLNLSAMGADKTIHIPPNYVVRCVTTHRKPPEVRIWRLSIQSDVGTRPPSTSTPHCPACKARRW